jgi:hypothetical protein
MATAPLPFTDNGGNRIGTSDAPINPRLGPLADNGGPTKTHALLLGSPALGAGDLTAVAGMEGVPEFDQRGASFSRIVGGRIDIGAYERQPQPLVVDILDDESDGDYSPGDLSFREAIGLSNLQLLPTNTILFDDSIWGGAIVLTEGQLNISASVTIEGPGADLMTIDASGNDPTPDENNGDGSVVFFSDANGVEIAGLTITGADAGGRAAISGFGMWSVTDSVISGNAGPGILGHYALLAVTRSTISGNGDAGIRLSYSDMNVTDSIISANEGGGIFVGAGQIRMTRTTVSGNSKTVPGGDIDGGGIFLGQNTQMTILSSTITGNSVSGDGGGIFVGGITFTNPIITVIDSTISGNSAGGKGGGIYCKITYNMTLIGCTISGNSANGDGGGIFRGAIVGRTTIYHTTISQNRADADHSGGGAGGGLFNADVLGLDLTIDHAILAGNSRGTSSLSRDDASGAVAARYSLIGDNTGGTITDNGGNVIGTNGAPIDPLLGPLADNGGPTLTYALLTGSPAINAGDLGAKAGMDAVPEFDQRGMPWTRVAGGQIDIGAVELQANPLPGDGNFDGTVDADDYGVWTSGFGSTTDLHGDFNRDGAVDTADYVVWRKNLGQSLPPPGIGGGASAVVTPTQPSPSARRSADGHSSLSPTADHRHQTVAPRAISPTEQPARKGEQFRSRPDPVIAPLPLPPRE